MGLFDVVTNDNSVIAQQGEILDLGSTANWVVSSSRANISVPATVPGGIYSDLRQVKDGIQFLEGLTLSQAGVLNQDLYYRFNDVKYRYIVTIVFKKYGEEKHILYICLPYLFVFLSMNNNALFKYKICEEAKHKFVITLS